jgi:hypothetical protein
MKVSADQLLKHAVQISNTREEKAFVSVLLKYYEALKFSRAKGREKYVEPREWLADLSQLDLPDIVTFETIFEGYQEHIEGLSGQKDPITKQAFSKLLLLYGVSPLNNGRPVSPKGKKQAKYYAIRNSEKWREAAHHTLAAQIQLQGATK